MRDPGLRDLRAECAVRGAIPDRANRLRRSDTETSDERLGHNKLPIHNLERQRGERSRAWPINYRGSLARVVTRVVAGTFENLPVRGPVGDFAARVRADGRIGHDAV